MNFISCRNLIFAVVFYFQYVTSLPLEDGDGTLLANAAPAPVLERDPQQSFDQAMRNAFAPAFAPGFTGDPVKDALVARKQRPQRPKSGSNTGCATQQSNICSSGLPYCCSTTNGKYSCVQSTVDCAQTVICCNNSFGVSNISMVDRCSLCTKSSHSFKCV